MAESDGVLARIEPWSPTLFLIAAAFLIVHAGHHGLEAFVGFDYPLHHEVPFGTAGFILGFVALLGLYPKLADRRPWLVRVGAVFAVLGAVSWFMLGAMGLAESVGADPPEWLGVFGLLFLIGVVIGYLCFSVASLRSDVLSRTTGFMLLTPILVMALNLSIVAAGLGSPEGQFVVASGFALAHLGIGFSLRVDDVPAGRVEPRPAEV